MFLFFGLVAVTGSYYVQTEELTWESLALAVPVGLLAAAILVVNNVRDIDTDRRAGKRTLAVKLGRERARVAVRRDARRGLRRAGGDSRSPAACPGGSLLPLASVPLAPPLWRTVSTAHRRPVAERAPWRAPGRLLAVFSLLLSAGILLS